ncbi:mediator of RNA polymerase II transcription subunit 12 [Aspergillus heteromorphus CBS 117.55]|uniref:Mediator of RNA polymerase II transcription subunit 12 n=1 Tax=Aspergillus heteromorphus CBS 117.55 TaxID=1448321 RepID=A0A317UZL5_9EURO|nr:mediator of RNA polymerase II transcription subunit 12 [Aspergillus heteromorphus CBS 117.55]PWY67503.1 mediator of RNA polymerase II transcription subunit 12 [Aspergillus heteromorphus CBS 117.55]
MIPHPSAGVQPWGRSVRALNNGSGRVDVAQAMGQPDPQLEKLSMPAPQPLPRQPAVIDLTTGASDSQDREPPAKRLKLEVPSGSGAADGSPAPGSGGELRSTPGTAGSKPQPLSWRGRPVWSFQALISETTGTAETKEDDTASQGRNHASPPPLPLVPWKYTPQESSESDSAKTGELPAAKEVQTTPYHIVIPSDAPKVKGERVADFSPWTGNHPEDILNEHTAKQGHYDRTQVSQNETNTARPSLYAQLKHRSGLQMLSSVFAAALEKRQNHNTVTAPSSFKPPPRVTLTDNKREAWLRDLANPSVPLRKLSRTIPHGIRGKVLLDQCLGKCIPVPRAVWLARCVGANEIRAFKRKGTSGALALGLETKWVRDWTSTVQQFLESVVSSCGTPDWKMKMTYAVSLTSRLFFERLLDHDQYLAWFLLSLEAAPLNTVPVWLLMLGIYWSNIMRYRKRGRRLAEVLLEKLRQIKLPGQHTALEPLVERLSRCIRRMVLEHTSSVILPNSWDKYKDLISSCLNLEEMPDKTMLQNLAERNVRVQLPKIHQKTAQRLPQQHVIHLFDTVRSTHDVSSTSSACLNAVEDKASLVSKLLEWAATPFRHGFRRVYISVRLLRKWKMSGVDVDTHILAFLANVQVANQLNMDNVYHIIAELVRSQTFSVGKYLQWLMAKGVTNDPSASPHETMSNDVRLLLQLPLARLPEYVRSLRNTLLNRAGIPPSQEESTIAAIKASIAQQLPKIFGAQTDDAMLADLSLSDLTWAVKSEIGLWIRRGVTGHFREPTRKYAHIPLLADSGTSALTAHEFYNLRNVLESFGDISMLADVLKQATTSGDSIVLASVADTVNYHFDSLCVIGAATDLFKGLVESYARLKRIGLPGLDLIFSLIELGLRMPSEFNTVALLRQDLSRIEGKSALAAPSPLSDHIPMTSGGVDSSFQEKLDQILFSGGGLDESSLDSVFTSLTRALGNHGQDKLSANDICRYLAYLRSFHPKRFDAMLVRWVCGLLKSPSRSVMTRILPPLIGVGCVTIHAFVMLVRKLLQSERVASVIPNVADLRLNLLELLVPPEPSQSRYVDMVTYRFYLAQQEFLDKHPEQCLEIIRDAVPLHDTERPEAGGPSQTDLSNCAVILLRTLLTQKPERMVQSCMQKFIGQHPASTAILQKALDSLLGFDPQSTPDMSEAERVISINNDFSLPICQLKLQILFNAEAGSQVDNGIVDVMFKAAMADARSNRDHWYGLVSLMSLDAVRQIRERAERGFFSVPMHDESTSDSSVADKSGSIETARLYLTIIEKLAYSIPEVGAQSVASALVEKMELLLQKFVSMQPNSTGASDAGQTAQARSNFERSLAFWFSALLRLIVIHRAAFNTPSLAPRPTGLQEQARLLTSIFCISLARLPDRVIRLYPSANYFPHPVQSENYRPCPGILLQTHALDVAAALIDTFPDEARHQCARFLREKCPPFLQFQNDPRFLYLLGPIVDTSNLNPTVPASLPSPAAGASTPTPTANLPGGAAIPQQAISSAPSGLPAGLSEGVNCIASHLRLQYRGRVLGAYPVRPWELLEDAAPIVGMNDTAVSLKYFDARRVRA